MLRQPNYPRRLEKYLNSLMQPESKNQRGTLKPGERIVFGETTIEELEEQKRKEDQEAEINHQH